LSGPAIVFAAIGDYGEACDNLGPAHEAAVANLVKGWNPEFIITLGDNNYPSGTAFTIDTNIGQFYSDYIYPYTGSWPSSAIANRFWPTMGNHDWYTYPPAPYYSYFTLPGHERYYEQTDAQNLVHLFALDSDANEPDGNTAASIQAAWLQNALGASTATWDIVFLHHCPYSSSSYAPGITDMRWPFAAWGADAVLAGHAHHYERLSTDGIPYFVNGAGGGDLYDWGTTNPASQFRYNTDWGAQRIEADNTHITFKFLNTSGTEIDSYTLYRPTPTPTPVPVPIDSGDYNGDGTSDIAVFRGSYGFWSVRNLTRVYFGASTDSVVPADYDGDGTTDIAVFRGSYGSWSVRDISRFYWGSSGDLPVPGDYDGDGAADAGIFRESNGQWSIRDVTRIYLGATGDIMVPGDYDADGARDAAIFRPGSGLWSIRNLTRFYFGSVSDTAVPGDYAGAGFWEAGIFRGSYGLWSIRNVTRVYLGSANDRALPADYNGDGRDEAGIFRDSVGLWSVRSLMRVYFGSTNDIPVTR
jgi:hypothetical protein